MKKSTRVVLCLVLSLLLAFGTVLTASGEQLTVGAGPESAKGVIPTWYSVNENRLIEAGAPVQDCYKYKVDPPRSGTYPVGGGKAVTVTFSEGGTLVDWSANFDISHVYVKGGKDGGGSLYSYDPPCRADEGLGVNDKLQQISHVTFFWCPGPEPVGSISGYKFNDVNANGIHNPETEQPLAGWTIELYGDEEMTTPISDCETGSDGEFVFSNLPMGTYYVKEVLNGDEFWVQTAPMDPNYYTLVLTEANKDIIGLAFGNVQYARLTVKKYYDFNKNGQWDKDIAKEVELNGWKVNISGETGDKWTPATVMLLPGEYTVTEYMPNENCWEPTKPTSVTVTLEPGDDVAVLFGNVCKPKEKGNTIGFWANKNGQSLITAADVVSFNNMPFFKNKWYSVSFASKGAIADYLKNANADNMTYMLSAQTIAMTLNVRKGFVGENACVLAPGVPGADTDYVITIKALLAAAIDALRGSDRQLQEAIKNALDNANNNRNFVVPSACAYTFN